MKRFSLIQSGVIMGILLSLMACSEKQTDVVPVYSVDVQQRDSADQFFSGYDYVMLETNESCVLGEVEGMKVDESVIAVKERDRVLLFGRDGKFISKIDKRGHGAGEYLSLEDFCVRDSLVYVLSRAQKRILVYDWQGACRRTIDLDDWYQHFEILDDELMVLSSEYSNEKHNNFVLFNYAKDEYTEEFSPFEKNEGVAFGDFFPFGGTFDGGRYALLPFDYTVYRLTSSDFKPYCRFEFNTAEQINHELPLFEQYEETANRNVVKYLHLYEEYNGSIYMTFDLYEEEGGIGTYVYKIGPDKETRIFRIFEKFSSAYPYISAPYGVYDGSFYSMRNAMSIMYIENRYGLSLFRDKGLTEESNPVVFFHKLK